MRYLLRRKEIIGLIFLLAVSVFLRLSNLSYSEFQGDEIRALYVKGAPLTEFLLSQKKGPIQFLVTFAVSLFSERYDEFITRSPFFLAGVLSVFIFYFFIRQMYGKKVALLSSLFLSVNGFFVAFSRIVQYQSFTFLFYLLSLFFFEKLRRSKKLLHLILSFIFLGLGLLAHYDGAFVLLIVAYFLYQWLKGGFLSKKLYFLFFGFLIFTILVSLFYVPFLTSSSFSNTKSYLFERLEGGVDKVSDTSVTFKLYNPLFTYYFLILFFVAGVIFGNRKLLPMFLWLLPSFITLNFIASVPGTHIYNYLPPTIVIASYGIVAVYKLLENQVIKITYGLGVSLAFLFFLYQSYLIFVDHEVEYPWAEKKILFWKVSMPSDYYHLSIFGFPYNRRLKEANEFIRTNESVASVLSNEGDKLIKYYIKPLKDPMSKYDLYIYVYNSQSLLRKKSGRVKNQAPIESFYDDNGNLLTEVYLVRRKL